MEGLCLVLVVMGTTLVCGSPVDIYSDPSSNLQTYTSGFAASSGPDGKMYYVKNVNGHVERGVLNGPLPSLDLSPVFANAYRFPMNIPSYNADLSMSIQNSVNQYMRNLGL